ncbi:hypothetical protein BH09ACT10_BH09ACT10_20250 [soil metagenome]
MTDEEFVAGLQAIFDANDLSDGVDRHHGFGTDVWVTGMRPVDDGDFPELEVTYQLQLPKKRRFKNAPRTGTTRVLFGQEWRAASGLDTPASYIQDVARAVEAAATRQVQAFRDSKRLRRERPGVMAESTGSADALWNDLLSALRQHHVSAEEVSTGVIEVVESHEAETFWLHVSRGEWQSYIARVGTGNLLYGGLDANVDEEIASRWDDEHHIVFFRGTFHKSIRAELPPVSSVLLRTPTEPIPGGRWMTVGSDGAEHYFDEEDEGM